MFGSSGVRLGARLAAFALVALLASCGGGETGGGQAATRFRVAVEASVQPASNHSAADLRSMPLAATSRATADPAALDLAEQLLDFAESTFPAYFPGHPNTDYFEGYLYRYYGATGAYLGVRDGNVYVMGGPFGSGVQSVGPLLQFITPAPLNRDPCLKAGATYGVHATTLPAMGRGAGAVLAGCTGPIGSPVWKQTAGPGVTLLSEHTQAISFDPPQPGTYRFEVSFMDPAKQPRTETVSITVPESAAPVLGVTVRVHHAVRSGGRVSLRAWPRVPQGETLRAVSWRQLEGPSVSFDTDTKDSHLATFIAPAVTRDTLLRLRATVQTESGLSVSDDVLVMVENFAQASLEGSLFLDEHVQRVHPYRANSPYASELAGCTYDPILVPSGRFTNLCIVRRLPLLAQGSELPTVEQVMDRVLVSHDWMGRNFETLLRTRDPNGDFRRMLRSVSAIVIGSHIRPSFYLAPVATIFLDADTFWLSAEERDTVNEAPDYRIAFGSQLQYDNLARYVKDGRNVFRYYDPRERVARTMDDVQLEAAPLLFHELGHALDYLPPEDYPLIDSRLSAWANMLPRYNRYRNTSDVVASTYPLESYEMYELAMVRYRGVTPTEQQKAYRAEDVARFFAFDRANDPYAYSTDPEDTAMLIEEFLMRHRMGAVRDVAFSATIGESDTSGTIIVRWGQRGRVGLPDVRIRAREVVRQLTPWIPVAEVDALPPPEPLRAGASWRDNLALGITDPAVRPLSFAGSARERREFQHERRRMHGHRSPVQGIGQGSFDRPAR